MTMMRLFYWQWRRWYARWAMYPLVVSPWWRTNRRPFQPFLKSPMLSRLLGQGLCLQKQLLRTTGGNNIFYSTIHSQMSSDNPRTVNASGLMPYQSKSLNEREAESYEETILDGIKQASTQILRLHIFCIAMALLMHKFNYSSILVIHLRYCIVHYLTCRNSSWTRLRRAHTRFTLKKPSSMTQLELLRVLSLLRPSSTA